MTSAGKPGAADGAASPITHAPAGRRRFWHLPEDVLGLLCLAAMVVLPLVEIVGRPLFDIGVPGSVGLVQHLTMWVAFVGAMIASRQRRHLALATATFLPRALRGTADVVAAAATATVGAVLAYTSGQMVYAERLSVQTLTGGLPIWAVQTILPLGFAVVALRAWWQAGVPAGVGDEPPPVLSARRAWERRLLVLVVVLATVSLAGAPESMAASVRWPLIVLLLAATVLGAPIFVTLGGAALVLFYADIVPLAAVPSQTYGIVSSPTLPTIPLFTLAGVLLAEGGTPARLVRLFQALAGLAAGRHRRRDDPRVRLLHHVHGRLGRHDSRARRPAAAGPDARRVLRAVLAGGGDGGGEHRPAVPAEPAGDPLRDLRPHAGQRDVRGGPGARPGPRRPRLALLPARGDRARREVATARPDRGRARSLGSEVGDRPPRDRVRQPVRRLRDDRGGGGDHGGLRLLHQVHRAPRRLDHPRTAPGGARLGGAGRRRAHHPRLRARPDRLPDRRGDPDAGAPPGCSRPFTPAGCSC